MDKTLIVISDMHLGGAAPDANSPGFQICSAEGQKLLADFLGWIAEEHRPTSPIHLVVNGDSVDFLAEEPFAAFTADQLAAEEKLKAIIGRTRPIWDAFRAVVAAGVEVTFTLGNHDLELALPRPRQLLRETLGPGRVDLVFDNSAVVVGDVLIEHGNRYDGWNAVRHDALRRIRSAVSRGETAEEFPLPPGSVLVINVMNQLKQEFRFIDLLKPEQEAVLPMIAAFKPAAIPELRRIAGLLWQANRVPYRDDGTPDDPDMIAARAPAAATPTSDVESRTAAALITADRLARDPSFDPDEISMAGVAKGILDRWRAKTQKAERLALVDTVYEALQSWLGADFKAFNTDYEQANYLKAVRTSAQHKFSAVLYGHTHLAKRFAIEGTETVYINTGTWADLMAVPRAVLSGSDMSEAKRQLGVFLDDLAGNRLDRWKQVLPTFARLRIEGGRAVERDLCLYRGSGKFDVVAPGRLEPLGRDPTPLP
jgi:UDP-2,3-diacylglucosamine pyrophosphatase LpxH